MWNPFGFFTSILECLKKEQIGDQGEGGEIQSQSPGGSKTRWGSGYSGEARVWEVR